MTPVYLPPISLGGGTFMNKILFKLNTIYAAYPSINIPNKLDKKMYYFVGNILDYI